MENDFVDGETVRLPLSEGRWIEVKKELTYGEDRTLQGYAINSSRKDSEEFGPEYARWFLKRFTTWIVDWSLKDHGEPVPITDSAIAALRPTVAGELEAALNKHIEEVSKNEQSASKNTVSSPTKTTMKKSTTEK